MEKQTVKSRENREADHGRAGRAKNGHPCKPNIVFVISAVISLAIAIWGIVGSSSFTGAVNGMMTALETDCEGLYLYGMTFFVLFAVVLAASPYGRVKLGPDDGKPEHGRISWFAMLFAAGMGIGLVFWGVAEPLSHYVAPMAGIAPMSEESARFSMRSCFMHWGLHPWACYAIVGLALAFFQFRRGKPALTSTTVEPIIGRQAYRALGKGIDIYTTVLTVIGVATSFGMGTLQLSSGLNYLFGIPNGIPTWVVLVVVVTCIFLWSSVSGVNKGIKVLSDINLVLFFGLMAIAFFVGSRADIVSALLCGVADYIVNFFPDAFRMNSNGDASWILSWRVFYWAWWLSWAPFVGIFIARISKGRTVREFVFGVIFVPAIVSILWFSVMGGLAIDAATFFSASELATIVASPQTTLFIIFSKIPLGMLLSVIAMVLLFIFFITSADSATFVLAMLTTKGDLNPPASRKIFWGATEALMALALVLSGGVSVIQTVAIVVAFPFFFIMLLMCASIVKALHEDRRAGMTCKTSEAPADHT